MKRKEPPASHDALFESIQELVLRHSPSGVEREIDEFLMAQFKASGHTARIDPSGNLIVHLPGNGGGSLALTAHKDEIGASVTSVAPDGRLRVRKLGGSYPWVYGEGVVDLLGDRATISGILSFGSRHVSHASPQHAQQDAAPVKWADAWVETKRTPQELADAGVRIGTRMVIGRHRKAAFRLSSNHIASYALDDRAALAILLELARRIQSPRPDLYLVATTKEEVGAIGSLYFTQHQPVDVLIALEIAPVAPEYSIEEGSSPVVLAEDSFGPYDEALNEHLRRVAARRAIPIQTAIMSTFGSDASVALKAGHLGRGACLGFPTQNSHGYEIAHLGAIANCIDVLEALCEDGIE